MPGDAHREPVANSTAAAGNQGATTRPDSAAIPDLVSMPDTAAIRFDDRGLVPVIVQDRATREVLMLGYADAEALEATGRTGLAHFHSRSRGRLWCKGETSGNVLAVRRVRLDCDGDTVLFDADPAGPTCHTGARTCFIPPGPDRQATRVQAPPRSAPPAPQPGAPDTPAPWNGAAPAPAETVGCGWLEVLWATSRQRATTRPAGSYTVRLLDGGVDAAARKGAEEAAEVLMAAKDDAYATGRDADGPGNGPAAHTRIRLIEETADLLFHVLVLAAERNLDPADVIDELRRRHTA